MLATLHGALETHIFGIVNTILTSTAIVVGAYVGRGVVKVGRKVDAAGDNAKIAANNTGANGHGLVAKDAIGVIVDDVKDLKLTVGRVVDWQAQHKVSHEFADAAVQARLQAGAALMRRLEQRLDVDEAK